MQHYSGILKTMPDSEIKRLIIQLLIMRVLKEQFETSMVRGINVKKIYVNLVPGSRRTV